MPIRQIDFVEKLAKSFVKKIIRLYEISKIIRSDRDNKFISRL